MGVLIVLGHISANKSIDSKKIEMVPPNSTTQSEIFNKIKWNSNWNDIGIFNKIWVSKQKTMACFLLYAFSIAEFRFSSTFYGNVL